MKSKEIMKETVIKNTLSGLMLLLLLLSALFMLKGWMEGHFSSIDSLRTYMESFGSLAPFLLMLIQALQVVLPVLPGFLGCIVGSILFGASKSFWINYIGISTGSIIAYWLARRYGVSLIQMIVPMEKYKSWIQWIQRQKSYSLVLFLAILLPLAPDDFLCYFSGLTTMSAKKFTWIILLGKPWCILFYCIFFSHFI